MMTDTVLGSKSLDPRMVGFYSLNGKVMRRGNCGVTIKQDGAIFNLKILVGVLTLP
jgi:hypothetical protein